MTPEQLLQHCERLTHAGRLQHMVELGQLAASDASVRNTIAALAQGDVYQRLLATQSCYGSRNATQVLRALADPSHCVRSLALHLVALFCSNYEFSIQEMSKAMFRLISCIAKNYLKVVIA